MADTPQSDDQSTPPEASGSDTQNRFRELARQTQNPVYAWMALWARGTEWQRQMDAQGAAGDFQIPEWCANYFIELAFDMIGLAYGIDVRSEYAVEADSQSDPKATELEPPPGASLSPDEAMKQVTFALGFTRPGYNAFSAVRNATEQMEAFNRFEVLRQAGLSYEDALQALGEKARATEASVIRRRVTKGRRLVGPRRT